VGYVPDLRHDFEINRYLRCCKPGKGNPSGLPLFLQSDWKKDVLSYKDTAGVPRSGHPHSLV